MATHNGTLLQYNTGIKTAVLTNHKISSMESDNIETFSLHRNGMSKK
jgi:hypothetical protein